MRGVERLELRWQVFDSVSCEVRGEGDIFRGVKTGNFFFFLEIVGINAKREKDILKSRDAMVGLSEDRR